MTMNVYNKYISPPFSNKILCTKFIRFVFKKLIGNKYFIGVVFFIYIGLCTCIFLQNKTYIETTQNRVN